MKAIAHDTDVIGNFNDFVQTMGHIDHADILLLQLADHRKQMLHIIGGEISGPGATSTQPLYRQSNATGRFRSVGLRFPRAMDVLAPPQVGTVAAPGEIEIIGCDDGVGGHIEKEWGFATSRTRNGANSER